MGSVIRMANRYRGLTEPEVIIGCGVLSSLSHEGLEVIPLLDSSGEWEIGVFDDVGHVVAGVTRMEGCIRAFDHDQSLPGAAVYGAIVYAAAAIVLALTSKPTTLPQ